ncbi:MAG: hypothetical protein WD066_09245 [Planctomycetaceae bacterium]
MSVPSRNPQRTPALAVEDLARQLLERPDEWLDTNNDQLGGEKPRDLIGTPKEPVLRNLLEGIMHGSFS